MTKQTTRAVIGPLLCVPFGPATAIDSGTYGVECETLISVFDTNHDVDALWLNLQ